MVKSHFRKIVMSSGAVRFYERDGWTFAEIKRLAKGSRIIYFNDEHPYFIADTLDVNEVMKYMPVPIFALKEHAKYSIQENIEMRNL